MQVSDELVDFIKSQEGFSPVAYKPLPTDRFTLGYGSTFIDGEPVQEGDTITEEMATRVLTNSLNAAAAQLSIGLPLVVTQQQFDAVISLAYNIGISAFKNSLTGQYFYQGKDISDRFSLYNKSGGTVIQGLVNRRQKETQIYTNGVYTT